MQTGSFKSTLLCVLFGYSMFAAAAIPVDTVTVDLSMISPNFEYLYQSVFDSFKDDKVLSSWSNSHRGTVVTAMVGPKR